MCGASDVCKRAVFIDGSAPLSHIAAMTEPAAPAAILPLDRRALLRGGAWLGLGATLAGAGAGRALAQAAAWPRDWRAVRALIDSYVGPGRLANAVATLGREQRAPEFIARGTLTIGQPARADADSHYRNYSMTKPINGMAVMQLIAEGKLALDQPLAEIIPAFGEMRVQRSYDGSLEDTVPAERPITIRHLLTHTAGLGYSIIQRGPIRQAYEQQGLTPGPVSRLPIAQLMGRAPTVRGLDVFAERLAALPLVAQPGTRWSYSVSLDLLGRVIEVVSGQSFAEFLHERLFAPAGMTSTFFQVPPAEAHRLTTNYFVMGGALVPLDPAARSVFLEEPGLPAGGAGLVSSPRDYDRFLRMLLGYGLIDGKRVLAEDAVRIGTSNLLPEGVVTTGTFAAGGGFGAGGRVGLGEQAGTYGWAGAAGTVGLVDLRRGLRANFMTQYMPAEAYPLHSAFPAAVMADLAGR